MLHAERAPGPSARLQSRVRRAIRRRRTFAITVVVIGAALMAWLRLGPIAPGLLDDLAAESTVIVDRRGVPLYEALSEDGTRSVALTADRLPPVLVAATVAVEDHRFRFHPGVDPIAMIRAAVANLTGWRTAEGGSTITQQVAKLLLTRRVPHRQRGVGAKISEAVLALRLEHRFSKREILTMYLNLASYGNQIAGAERASHAYFGRPAAMLTPAQAAFLAGLPQRPSGFNPYRHRDSAVVRQHAVLRRMRKTGVLTPAEFDEARQERLVLARLSTAFLAPHLVNMALERFGETRPGRIETTLDRDLQADVAGIISNRRELLARHGAANVAVVVLDNASADWLAWEGSGDYFDEVHGGTINGPSVGRQPGSALKPFTYALAFEQGFTPASVLPDVPSSFPTAEPGILYKPRNYDGRYRGPLRARLALAGSQNVPAVALAATLGVPGLMRFLERGGLTTFNRNPSYYGLGLTLGNAEVRLDELVAAYAALARGGEWIAPDYLRDTPRARRDLVSPRTAFWIADILSDPEAREYVFGRGGSLEFPFSVAVKTGTSQAYHDNWTIGYSRHVTVGVWVGNFDRAPLRESTGVTGAGPIFHAVMLAAERRWGRTAAALPDAPVIAPPAGTGAVISREICALSGQEANSWCPVRRQEWLARGSPPLPCSWHHLDDGRLITVWPDEYRHWAGARDTSAAFGSQSVAVRDVGPAARQNTFRIVSPADGSTFLIDPTLRREFQAVPLRAVSGSEVRWEVDGRPYNSPAGRSPSWPLTPGRHSFVASDISGRKATSTVVVR
jgi:penicillin-binding protein 1C